VIQGGGGMGWKAETADGTERGTMRQDSLVSGVSVRTCGLRKGFIGFIMSVQEKLIIKNFFTIADFDWNVKGFNVLTGCMGSGKSLALKLLYFCEQIFHLTIFSEPALSKENFSKTNYFDIIANKFNKIFTSNNSKNDFYNTKIKYEYIFLEPEENYLLGKAHVSLFEQPKSHCFDLSAEWNDEKNKFIWSSNYISNRLSKWEGLFDMTKTPDLSDKVRNSIYNTILTDFQNSFPLASMFIPASRAIVAIANNFSSRDIFVNQFINLKNFALEFDDISSELVNKILRLKSITISDKKEPIFELLDGRKISSLELSSGQQELVYLLLLVNDLKKTVFIYGKSVSVFIEEPSAHLFPKEQKETIEFLVECFNLLQQEKENDPGHRFFISTHSPYVLNTINNILEKNRLLKKASQINNAELQKEKMDDINNLPFPDLSIDNISAYMIEENGHIESIIDASGDDTYLYASVIDAIAQDISSETDKLYTLNSDIDRNLARLGG
jgi:predicted ATPase